MKLVRLLKVKSRRTLLRGRVILFLVINISFDYPGRVLNQDNEENEVRRVEGDKWSKIGVTGRTTRKSL